MFYAPLFALSYAELKLLVVQMTICAYKSRQILAHALEIAILMRLDILTVAVLIFVLGIVLSSLSLSEVFPSEPLPPAPHQQGFAIQ